MNPLNKASHCHNLVIIREEGEGNHIDAKNGTNATDSLFSIQLHASPHTCSSRIVQRCSIDFVSMTPCLPSHLPASLPPLALAPRSGFLLAAVVNGCLWL